MEYFIPIILILISYILGTFFAFQGLRSPIDRPLIYTGKRVFFLNLIFGWAPMLLALYLAYKNVGIIFALIIIGVRFFVLPIFNDGIKKVMDKKGI